MRGVLAARGCGGGERGRCGFPAEQELPGRYEAGLKSAVSDKIWRHRERLHYRRRSCISRIPRLRRRDGARAGRTEEDGISRKLANRGGRRIQVDRQARSGRGGYRKLVRAQRMSRNWCEADTLWG